MRQSEQEVHNVENRHPAQRPQVATAIAFRRAGDPEQRWAESTSP
jgi:hypothetical protein